ncbi:MAG: hypothetical protein R3E86_21805 [Pseudomonadales bacterium]
MHVKIGLRTGAAWTLLLATGQAYALELDVAVANDSEYSTNIRRTSDDEISEWRHEPGVDIAAVHEGERYTLNGAYSVFRRIHQKSEFDDDTVSVGSSGFEWRAIPDALVFDIQDSRTETVIDSQLPDDFNNRQVVGRTSAGARATVPSIGAHTIELSYRVEHLAADTSETDSDRTMASAAYNVPLTQTSTLSLSGTRSTVDFDDPLAPDYKSWSGRLAYSATRRQSSLTAGIGYTTNDRELSRDTASGVTGDIDLTYAFSEITTGSIGYSHQFQDNTNNPFGGLGAFGGQVGEQTSGLSELFIEDSAYANISTEFSGTTVSIGLDASRSDYEDIPRDEKRASVTLDLSREVRPGLTVAFYSALSRVEFVDADDQYDELRTGIRTAFDVTRKLSAHLDVEYQKRKQDVAPIDYDVWGFTVGLRYALVGARRLF